MMYPAHRRRFDLGEWATLDELSASHPFGYYCKCLKDCVAKKPVRVFPNLKPWKSQEVHSLLKIKHAAFKSDRYRKSRYDLCKAIREAKRQSRIPTYFKKTTTIPVPKKTHAVCFNDYCPIALTSIVMKCFKRLVLAHINSSLPTCPEPLQFAYRHNRSTQDAISLALHSSPEHLDNKDTYVRLLFVDYGSAFNTTIPSTKLHDLGLSFTLCNWILSFLTHRLQSARIDATVKKAQQCLFFLRQLKKFGIRSLTNLYRCIIESTLSGCITAWNGNCSAQDREKLQKVVCTAQTITEANLLSMDNK
eukprot:g40605.t1